MDQQRLLILLLKWLWELQQKQPQLQTLPRLLPRQLLQPPPRHQQNHLKRKKDKFQSEDVIHQNSETFMTWAFISRMCWAFFIQNEQVDDFLMKFLCQAWRILVIIDNHCKISYILDTCVQLITRTLVVPVTTDLTRTEAANVTTKFGKEIYSL